MLQHQDAVPGLTASVPVAERHLERDLDRGGAAIREEDAGETCGCAPQQPARNLFCWLVRVAREDQLVEPPRLFGDRRRDAGMAMAARRPPPARTAVDHTRAVGAVAPPAFRSPHGGTRTPPPVLGGRETG